MSDRFIWQEGDVIVRDAEGDDELIVDYNPNHIPGGQRGGEFEIPAGL